MTTLKEKYELLFAEMTAINSECLAIFPPGVESRKRLSATWVKEQKESRCGALLADIHAEEARIRDAVVAERVSLRAAARRLTLARSPRHRMAGLARRLRAAGIQIERSDRSETVYIGPPDCRLRLSFHELGVADYGTRVQVHHGPEVVLDLGCGAADALTECISEFREAARCLKDRWHRKEAARLLLALRLCLRRAR